MWKFNLIAITTVTLLVCAALVVAPFIILDGFFAVTGGVFVALFAIKYIVIPTGKTLLDIAVPTQNQR
jgi:hypothetical protein